MITPRLPAAVPEKKEPKNASVKWFDRGEADLGKTETLLEAFMLVMKGFDSAKAGHDWAGKVRQDAAGAVELKSQWKPLEATWGPPKKGTSPLFEPMQRAFGAKWHHAELDSIGIAMQYWRGAGQHDSLRESQFRDYIKAQPIGVRKSQKVSVRDAPPRWRTWSIVHIADLVWRFGKEMRALVKLDEEPDFVLTSVERIEMLEKRNAQLEEELDAAKQETLRARDAHRHSAKRLKTASVSKTGAVRQVRAEVKAAAKEELKRRLADAAQSLREKVDAEKEAEMDKMEEEFDDIIADKEVKLKKARSRARAVEATAGLAVKRLKRAQAAEARVKEITAEIAAAQNDEEVCIFSLPESSSRRDARGRFEAEPWQMRPIRWAQLGRRCAPAAVGANINDVLAVFAPDVNIPQPTDRQMQLMRGELTIAGECIANFRVAKSKRIISFGFDESSKWGLGLMSTNTQIEPHDAPGTSVDVVQRGATLTAGGTAKVSADPTHPMPAYPLSHPVLYSILYSV